MTKPNGVEQIFPRSGRHEAMLQYKQQKETQVPQKSRKERLTARELVDAQEIDQAVPAQPFEGQIPRKAKHGLRRKKPSQDADRDRKDFENCTHD